MRKIVIFAALAAAALPLAARHVSHDALASSHREAPLISQDPVADSTDVYAFVSPDKPDTVTLIANYIGLEYPQGGPNWPRFGDDVLYAIHIDNVGDGNPHITYYFKFTTTIRNPKTFLYNTGPIKSLDDPNWNMVQTARVWRSDANGEVNLCAACPTPPVNVGAASTPNYDALAAMAISDLPGGGKFFAGQRADPFFVDLGAIFDLLQVRPPDKAVNTLKSSNVHTIAIQVPISSVTNDGKAASDPKGANAVIGVWTAAYRQTTTVVGGGTTSSSGDYVQVSRLGMPLTNEIIIPVGMKDYWNETAPANDAQFKAYHDDPEPANLLKLLYKVAIPPTPRTDITAIFLLGVPGLNMPKNGTPADELRLNLAIPPSASPNRLGVLGNDTQGFPNGRRLNDDVVDIEVQAVAGSTYPLIDSSFKPDPLASKLGDGVDGPDRQPTGSFPYEASPYAGTP